MIYNIATIDSLLKDSNAWLNFIFLFLAVFGILLSILFYVKSRREKLPAYRKRSFNLIKNQLAEVKGLRVTFEDRGVNNLTLTQVALWNRGRETINREDVAPTDPLRIVITPSHEILQAEIKYIRTKANNFSIELDNAHKGVLIGFDYFHTNDGIAINIYHTGSSDEDIQLLGTIKGVKSIKLITSERFSLATSMYKFMMYAIDPPSGPPSPLGGAVVLLLLPVILVLLVVDVILLFFKRTPREFKLEEAK